MQDFYPRYDPAQTYRWNYEHPPAPMAQAVEPLPGEWDFCGLKVDSPLGIAAGPLLCGAWCLYYAGLGFDVLTYKTVRSVRRECYPLPNLQPVDCGQLSGSEPRVPPCTAMRGSWAVSFGMPSSEPEVWRRDVQWTRHSLPAGKLLCVSVVGTIREGWSTEQLADDYATCARWAVESGADCVETNFSCPNVSTCDGQLFQDAAGARLVAQAVRAAIGRVPYVIKIGHLMSRDAIASLLAAVGDLADGLAMTNSVATTVGTSPDDLMFAGQPRGICGEAIREASVTQLQLFHEVVERSGHSIRLIGVGGISSAEHVRRYLAAGADACQLATAVMVNPAVGLEIRRQLSS
jgi:dihydroorotate dehydrogenase